MENNHSDHFLLDRPSLDPAWFDEYYRLYEYTEGEEDLEKGLRLIRPQGEVLQADYLEYFATLKTYWDACEAVCKKYKIRPAIPAPVLPASEADMAGLANDKLLVLKKDAYRALIGLLASGKRLFRHSKMADYLGASAEERLNIAEVEQEDDAFQMILIEAVEIRMDLAEILQDLQQYWPKYGLVRPNPDASVNPWLAGLLAIFRTTQEEGKLRERYARAAEGDPGLRWDLFLAQEALEEAARNNTFYALKLEETPLSYEVTARLNVHGAERIYDLLQITLEELRELEGISKENVKDIHDYLAANGCQLAKGAYAETWKISRREDAREREQRYGAYRAALRKVDALRKSCGDDPVRIRETVRAFHSLYRLCDEKNIDVRRRASILRLYCGFVMEKRSICPEITHNFNDYATAMVTHFEYGYGYMHLLVADAHRDVGKWLLELGKATTALIRFNLAASIYEERGAQDEAEKCYRLAAEAAAKQ